MRFSAAFLWAVLEDNLPAGATGLLVGLSGGRDSSCFLAVLAHARSLAGARAAGARSLPLRAVHVDHGLQAASAPCARPPWRSAAGLKFRSRSLASRWMSRAACRSRPLRATHAIAPSPAAQARRMPADRAPRARPSRDPAAAVAARRRPQGLVGDACAPPVCSRAGTCVRFSTSRPASCIGLEKRSRSRRPTIPMNRDPRFDRAYLRREMWPLIEGRWPAAARVARARGATSCRGAGLARRLTRFSVERLRDGEALSVSGLRALPDASACTWCGTG